MGFQPRKPGDGTPGRPRAKQAIPDGTGKYGSIGERDPIPPRPGPAENF